MESNDGITSVVSVCRSLVGLSCVCVERSGGRRREIEIASVKEVCGGVESNRKIKK